MILESEFQEKPVNQHFKKLSLTNKIDNNCDDGNIVLNQIHLIIGILMDSDTIKQKISVFCFFVVYSFGFCFLIFM